MYYGSRRKGELLEEKMGERKKQADTESLSGQVLRLDDLVEYQTNSIVSRAIISKNVGTVTLFAFDEGQQLSEHTAPFDALVFGLDGEAEITVSGKAQRLKAGEMIILPSHSPHSLRAIRKFKMILIMIRS